MEKVWGRGAASHYGENVNLYFYYGSKYKRFLRKLNIQLYVAQLYDWILSQCITEVLALSAFIASLFTAVRSSLDVHQ